ITAAGVQRGGHSSSGEAGAWSGSKVMRTRVSIRACTPPDSAPRLGPRPPGSRRGGDQALLDVGEDVVDVLEAHAEAHEARLDPGRALLLLAELRVRGRGGVDHQ